MWIRLESDCSPPSTHSTTCWSTLPAVPEPVVVVVPVVVEACPVPEPVPPELFTAADEVVDADACDPAVVPDWLPEVEDVVAGGVAHPVVLAWLVLVLPLDCVGDVEPAVGVEYQLVVDPLVVEPDDFGLDERLPAGVTDAGVVGAVFAEVFEALCVLAVPPFTVG